jgi:ABC-type methionine transport system permease subunit
MKITRNQFARTDKILKEVVWWTNAIIAVPVLFLLAALVPGDRVHGNVVGSLASLIMLGILSAAITLPCVFARRKIAAASAVRPVRQGARL